MSDKSFIAKIEEIILKATKPDYMDSKEKVEGFLNEKSVASPKVSNPIFKCRLFNGTEAFTFGDENSKNTIIYMHGGAYTNEINYQHFLYCLLLSRKLDAYVIAPVICSLLCIKQAKHLDS